MSGRGRGCRGGRYTLGGHLGPAPEGGTAGIYVECCLKPAPEGHKGGIYSWGVTSDQHPSETEQECAREVLPHTLPPAPALPQEAQQAPPSALCVPLGPPACGLRFPATPPGLAPPPPSLSPPHGITVSVVSPTHIPSLRRGLAAKETITPVRPRGAARAPPAWKCARPRRCGH